MGLVLPTTCVGALRYLVLAVLLLFLCLSLLSQTNNLSLSPHRISLWATLTPSDAQSQNQSHQHDLAVNDPSDNPAPPSAPLPNSTCDDPQPPSYPLQAPPADQHLPEVLLSYIAWHKTARACLLDASCTEKPHILISQCPKRMSCLGLGDRMRGIAFALTVAIVTKRVFFIQLESNKDPPFTIKAGMVPNTIDWTLPPTVPMDDSYPYLEWYFCRNNPSCDAGGPYLSKLPNFEKESRPINFWTEDVSKLFQKKPIITLASRMHKWRLQYLTKNRFLNETYYELGNRMLREEVKVLQLLFQPSHPAKKMKKKVDFEGEPYLAVHMRTGIDSEETDNERFQYISGHLAETVDKMLACIKRAAAGMNVTKVFVASDSVRAKELFLEKGRKNGLVVKLFEKNVIHMSEMRGLDERTRLCDGFVTIFADLFMLARAKVLFKTGSNFAVFANSMSAGQPLVHFGWKDVLEKACKPMMVVKSR